MTQTRQRRAWGVVGGRRIPVVDIHDLHELLKSHPEGMSRAAICEELGWSDFRFKSTWAHYRFSAYVNEDGMPVCINHGTHWIYKHAGDYDERQQMLHRMDKYLATRSATINREMEGLI